MHACLHMPIILSSIYYKYCCACIYCLSYAYCVLFVYVNIISFTCMHFFNNTVTEHLHFILIEKFSHSAVHWLCNFSLTFEADRQM